MRISITDTYRGKRILLTGASGFLGKVWLSMLLRYLSGVEHIYVLLRKGSFDSSSERLEDILANSHAMRPLHERYGQDFELVWGHRISALEGDISCPALGLDAPTRRMLQERVDLVVNCAGLVDFDPDIRHALDANVRGLLHLAQFTRGCRDAALLHTSTCYQAGLAEGHIPEEVTALRRTVDGEAWDVEHEYGDVTDTIAEIVARQTTPEAHALLAAEVDRALEADWLETDDVQRPEYEERVALTTLKKAMAKEGKRRARDLGFPNTYTWSKALAEGLLAARFPDVKWAIVRPAIVESARDYPFAGWNEGFNTCGPLAYLVGTWFKFMPARRDNPFDIIPVDEVTRAIFIVGAQLMRGQGTGVYHCGTSDVNRLTIERGLELTQLHHRRRLRKTGRSVMDRWVRANWDTTPRHPKHALRPHNLRAVSKFLERALRNLPAKTPMTLENWADDLADKVEDAGPLLKKMERAVDLFRPFTHDLFQVFESRRLRELDVEEEEFRYQPETIDWRSYWLETHMPGLRKWTFPLLRGEDPPPYDSPITFRLRAEPVDVERVTEVGA